MYIEGSVFHCNFDNAYNKFKSCVMLFIPYFLDNYGVFCICCDQRKKNRSFIDSIFISYLCTLTLTYFGAIY